MTSVQQNADPKTWGPALWIFLHNMAANYPDSPSPQHQASCRQFIFALRYLLPCKVCRDHFNSLLASRQPSIGSATELQDWVLWLHNKVNEKLEKNTTWDAAKLQQTYPLNAETDQHGSSDHSFDTLDKRRETGNNVNMPTVPPPPPPIVAALGGGGRSIRPTIVSGINTTNATSSSSSSSSSSQSIKPIPTSHSSHPLLPSEQEHFGNTDVSQISNTEREQSFVGSGSNSNDENSGSNGDNRSITANNINQRPSISSSSSTILPNTRRPSLPMHRLAQRLNRKSITNSRLFSKDSIMLSNPQKPLPPPSQLNSTGGTSPFLNAQRSSALSSPLASRVSWIKPMTLRKTANYSASAATTAANNKSSSTSTAASACRGRGCNKPGGGCGTKATPVGGIKKKSCGCGR